MTEKPLDARDAERMAMAIELARKAWGQTSPNPMVGAVIFNGDEKAGEGYHERFGSPHAEAAALIAAGERARGATMYVNLEPCNHHGRNPPCVDSVISAGIARVVAAVKDPNPLAADGATRLRAAGIQVDFGVMKREALELNASFFHAAASDRPWVTLKLALSLDGAIASAKRTRAWLTGEESQAEVHMMRANNDAIAVGVLTAIADDPLLTVRTDPAPRVSPVRIVFDRSARLPVTSNLARTARETPTLLVTSSGTRLPEELASLGVEAIGAHDIGDALRKLKERGIHSIMVEGGAGLAASFLGSGCVDRLAIFQAPIILGDGALNAFSGISPHDVEHAPRFSLIESRAIGDDVMNIYSVAKH